MLHVNGVITFGGDTRYGVSKIYDANTGDGFGLEQVSAAQSGLAGAGTRLFTANGGSNFISLGKYTNATAFTSWLHITQAGSVGIGTTSPAHLLSISSSSVGGSVFSLYNTDANANNRNWALKLNSSSYGDLGFLISASNGGNPESGTIAMTINRSMSVGMGTTSPAASAKLDLTSTTQGFLPPRMTNTQRLAISSPAVGLIVYVTTTVEEGLWVYQSTGWVNYNLI